MPRAVAGSAIALCVAMACASLTAHGQTLTAKEKLSSKGADEQRVNDCKVPPAQRTRSDRSTECADPPAAKLTVEALTGIIRNAAPSSPPQLAGQDLSGLDLSDMDFRQANLSGANLFGAKLVGANLA